MMLNDINEKNQKNNQGVVVSTNLSKAKGTAKRNVDSVMIDEFGVVGDAHAGPWHRQVSLISKESIDGFCERTKKKVNYGDFGENITFSGINVQDLSMLDKLRINETLLEITQFGKKCHGNVCAIYREVGQCVMPKEGLFARVINSGKISVGDIITHQPFVLKVLVITLSDRASAGVYADKSGAMAKEMLEQFFANLHWRWRLEQIILPDDAAALNVQLERALSENVDIIFTLGGTGVGARDITPETVAKVCDKFLPGIMEHIRLKYGEQHPAALLSRGVAGVANNNRTQIYTLPGSVCAVSEYLTEILKTLEHIIFMLHGVDRH